MPIVDIIIAAIIAVSIIVGFIRGFVKEAISIVSLLVAIWAAMYIGPSVGSISEGWLGSVELQDWFGRILVFVVILAIGGIIGWGVSKLVRLSILSGTDRVLGMIFGFCRGILIFGVAVILGQFANFDNDDWWEDSMLIRYGEIVADWIVEMGPRGLDLLQPDVILENIEDVVVSGVTPDTSREVI
jgi:membrane protein required for colicin V production